MTTQINIDTKSQLAKLIATENIQVQHNKVKTASFDTVNRILTLPVFKVQSGDVYDMLIAHECSHALYTPTDGWKKISDDDELRTYVNVLEDCRIDKKIQKKYPGVVKNYINGFDIMMKQNFFGLKDRDINTDLMLIDKINMYYKSSKRLSFNFSNSDKLWLKQVDKLKSFKDVVTLAKKLLNWQKKEVEKMKKLPDFDNHVLVENYSLDDKQKSENNINAKEGDSDTQSDKLESESAEDKSDGDNNSVSDNKDSKDDDKEVNTTSNAKTTDNDGGGQKLTAITDKSYEQNKEKLYDETQEFSYMTLPELKLENILVSNKKFVNDIKKYFANYKYHSKEEIREYVQWLKNDFKKFKSDNKKTIMYLVKEFEMKKAATAYKRATQDKTGVIDPLKLKNYKFSDDIFKRLTVLPNAKNHGMMMLLDWSGSMCDILEKTIHQLIQLVYFCQKVQIPFEVYAFTSEHDSDITAQNCFNVKHGNIGLDSFRLINIASHKLKKTQLDESLMYLYSMGLYYGNRYSRSRNWLHESFNNASNYNPGMPGEYHLGSTPLNEALVVCNKLVPMFKNKYKIEKLTFITLTDGAGNYPRGHYKNGEQGLELKSIKGKPIIQVNKKNYTIKQDRYFFSSEGITSLLLNVLRKQHGITTIGFYLMKKMRGWESERIFGNRYDDEGMKLRKQFQKDKVAIKFKEGYNEYYVVNAKDMNVENTDLSGVNPDMKAGRIKQLFSKSMTGRIKSRVLLNKFIQKVA